MMRKGEDFSRICGPLLLLQFFLLPVVLRRVFKAFHYRDFRLMWIGACTSAIGTWMQAFAQGWLIWELSHSARLLALDPILLSTPIFLFSLVGGVLADRFERRHMLIFSQVVQMSCALFLTFLAGFHMVKVWHFLTCSFICGFGQAFGGPAYSALIPTLVPKEDMPNAIALNSIQFNAAVMVGPALGGWALHSLGATWCFALNALSFFCPIVALLMLKVRFLPEKTGESILDSMKQGFHFIRRQGAMQALIVLGFCMTALGVPMRTFLPLFADRIFHGGSGTYAVFLSMSGVGSVLGALAVADFGHVRQKGRVALGLLMCLGAGIAGFAFSRSIPMACAMLFLAGASMVGVFAMVLSLVHLMVSNEMRGRVVSVYNLAFRGGMPVGNLVAGLFVPLFSAPAIFAVNGVVLVALGLYFFGFQRKVVEL